MKTLFSVPIILLCLSASLAFAQSGFNTACDAASSADLCLAIRTFATQATSLLNQNQPVGDLRSTLENAWLPVEIIIRRGEERSECFPQIFGLEMAANEFKSRISMMASASRMDSLQDNRDTRLNWQLELDRARARLLQYCPFL